MIQRNTNLVSIQLCLTKWPDANLLKGDDQEADKQLEQEEGHDDHVDEEVQEGPISLEAVRPHRLPPDQWHRVDALVHDAVCGEKGGNWNSGGIAEKSHTGLAMQWREVWQVYLEKKFQGAK